MTAIATALTAFEADVLAGLTQPQKQLPARYFYDEIGSVLFEVITRLPEYGLTRADERLLAGCAAAIAREAQGRTLVAELGSGSGTKTAHLLRALAENSQLVRYCPIDISQTALDQCEQTLRPFGAVEPVLADYLDGLELVREKRTDERVLLLFLGSTIGNFERADVVAFLTEIRRRLEPGDLFLIGADLVKPEEVLLAAYDDPLGVTAAFNLNVLRRVNQNCGADFDLRAFGHQARWNQEERRIEMHLVSRGEQSVVIPGLELALKFENGETIWTESSHKFTVPELEGFARISGFVTVATWTDEEWPFAETLWRAV
jgi:dimethylhistidine N-methyltransferase